jgi:cytochrome P450 family 135
VVIRTVLQQVDLRAADPAPERTKVHHITLIPAKGASVVVERRRRPTGPGERRAGAPAPALAT